MKEYKFKHAFLDVTISIKANTISDAILILGRTVKSVDDYVSMDYKELVLSFRLNVNTDA